MFIFGTELTKIQKQLLQFFADKHKEKLSKLFLLSSPFFHTNGRDCFRAEFPPMKPEEARTFTALTSHI